MKPSEILYLGLGAAYLAKEKLESQLKSMEERGQISRKEFEEFIEEAKSRGRKERAEMDKNLKKKIREVLDEMGVATKQDIEELKKHLAEK